jgi:hypothetical protein
MRNRCPSDVADPTEKVPVRSGSSSSVSVAAPSLLRATRARVASISGSPSSGQIGARGAGGWYGGQALLDVAPVRFEVNVRQRLEQRPPGAGQVAAGFQVVGQTLGLVERPRLEGGQKLALVDQPVLKREQSEEEMAVGGGSHGMAPKRRRSSGCGRRPPGLAQGSRRIGPIIACVPSICIRAAGYRRTASPFIQEQETGYQQGAA